MYVQAKATELWTMKNRQKIHFFSIMRVNDFMKATIVIRARSQAPNPIVKTSETCTHIVQRAELHCTSIQISRKFRHKWEDERYTHTRIPNKCKHVQNSSKCLSKFVFSLSPSARISSDCFWVPFIFMCLCVWID